MYRGRLEVFERAITIDLLSRFGFRWATTLRWIRGARVWRLALLGIEFALSRSWCRFEGTAKSGRKEEEQSESWSKTRNQK